MKKIILSVILLLTSIILNANEHTFSNQVNKGVLKPFDGKALYEKRCASCHGKNAKKSPLKNVPALAGRNATVLARITIAYREQDSSHGTAHTVNRVSQMMKEATCSLSNQQIGAIAKYIERLPKKEEIKKKK